jgi:hypothetical protein
MKQIITIIILVLFSCTKPKYKHIGQEIIDGKVSAIEYGHTGRVSTAPKIYVQDSKKTISVSIPFSYENRWKVGDSCLLIIEKYQIIQE